MGKPADLIGQRFGRLIVISKHQSTPNGIEWNCLCDCSNTKIANTSKLNSGATKSCGCLRKEKSAQTCKNLATHGMRNTRIYGIWRGIKKRCLSDTGAAYKNYKGRGITICSEWLKFEPFWDWARMNGYDKDLTIDRINNDDGYHPENCRWIPLGHQARNRRTTVLCRESVLQIRNLLALGMRNCEIAKIIGCNQKIISNIKHFRRWMDVE
jgi:hypothetical protein